MLSVIFLTRNEEDVLEKSLESIKEIADELVLVDSGSDDTTVAIAKKYGAVVYTQAFKDYASQRNFAMQKAKGDWVLYLDADEVATAEFRKEVSAILENPIHKSAYFLQRKNYFLGRDWQFTDKMVRLFYKKDFIVWEGVVHESAKVKGEVGIINAPVLHFTHRNLSQMLTKTNKWSEYEAKLRFDASHPQMNAVRFIRVMVTGFWQSYIKEKGYKNGTEGLIEGIYQSFSLFITYAKLWEMQVGKKK